LRAPRSRLSATVDRVINAAIAGEPHVSLSAGASELIAEAGPIATVIAAAMDRAGPGLTAHERVTLPFRLSGVTDELVNSLVSPNPLTRAAAARLCGALRLTGSVMWIADLIADPNPKVRDSAIRALGQMGGRRAVESLIAAVDSIPLHRLAITLSVAASDLDIEALMRQPPSEKAAVVTVLACGLRRDRLRVPPLLGIAHDRRWPVRVRVAACRSLGMIGERSAADGLRNLAARDPSEAVKKAAALACRRLEPPAEVQSA
jgi:hypothetical protein